MKKYIYFTIAACAVMLFNLQSCKKDVESSNQNKENNSDIKFSNGRMFFQDKLNLNLKLMELSQLSKEDFKQFENKSGFTSFKTAQEEIISENYNSFKSNIASASEKEYNKYTFVSLSLVANKNGEVQIGDSVYLFSKNGLLSIPYTCEKEYQTLKDKILNSNLKSKDENSKFYEFKIDTLNVNQRLKSLGAQYQKQWPSGPFEFKFVFESFRVYNPVGMGFQVVIQNKLEYWRSRSWPRRSSWEPAGESLYKTYSNLRMYNTFNNFSYLYNGQYSYSETRYTNDNFPVFSSFNNTMDITITGSISAYTSGFVTDNSYSEGGNDKILWQDKLN